MNPAPVLQWLSFHVGPLHVGATVLGTWLVMVLLVGLSWAGTRRLSLAAPTRWQSALEGVVLALRQAIEDAAPGHGARLLPFVGTLWLFIGAANLLGLVPGLSAPTGDLSLTAALAALVFVAVHVYGIRIEGLRPYLRHYLDPNPLLLPFHLLGEVTRTVALAIRLFGNMMSGAMILGILLSITPFLFPVVMTALGLLTGLVQAYIFTILAAVYIAAATLSRKPRPREASEAST